MSSDEVKLENLLRRLVGPSPQSTILELDDLQLLATAITPTAPRSSKSLSYLCVSKYSEAVQKYIPEPEDQTDEVVRTFKPYLDAIFHPDGDISADSLSPCVYLLTALITLFPTPALKLLTIPIDDDTDPPMDILSILLDSAELPSGLQPALAELLGQAAGTKAGRQVVRSRGLEWLKGGVDYGKGTDDLGALCAVALSKLGREESVPGAETNGASVDQQQAEEEILCSRMMETISQPQASSSNSLLPVIEGLSVLSARSKVKEQLANSAKFLSALVKLSPIPQARPSSLPVTPRSSMVSLDDERLFEPVETSLCYGLVTILANLTSRKPPLSAEDQQMAKLRQMAVSGKKMSAQSDEVEEDPLENYEIVEKRVQKVIKAGGVGALRGIGRAESRLVKEVLGVLCLNMVENKDNRLVFVRDGGYKVLSGVVRDLLAPLAKKPTSSLQNNLTSILPSLQALAKLVITTPPDLLFPPPSKTTALNALSPLYYLLVHTTASSLQTFESLMALTNLASIDPSIASRIAQASVTLAQPESTSDFPRSEQSTAGDGKISVISKIEELLLDDNVLVRRAATQLTCNLVTSSGGFKHFSGTDPTQPPDPTSTPILPSARVRSRLNILLVLSNVDDLPTRLAAGGALAILTESPSTCRGLLAGDLGDGDIPAPSNVTSTKKRSVWERLMWLFDPEDSPSQNQGEDDEEQLEVISSSQPNSDLVYRGVIILLNLLGYTNNLREERKKVMESAKNAKVEEKLMGLLRLKFGDEILRTIVECLKILKKG